MSFLNDIYLLLKHKRLLADTLKDNGDDNSKDFFTENEKKDASVPGIFQMIKSSFTNLLNRSISYDPIITCQHGEPFEEDAVWFFINGITVDRDFVKSNGLALSKLLGNRQISVLHNPTRGFAADLTEALLERSFNIKQDITLQMSGVLIAALKHGVKVRIIAHSQGTIILASALKIIHKTYGPEILNGLEVYTFAGALDELKEIPGVYFEHFANENDFVARVGVIECDKKIHGTTWIRKDATGHLLNTHYIGAMAQGLYCNKQSRFYKQYVSK